MAHRTVVFEGLDDVFLDLDDAFCGFSGCFWGIQTMFFWIYREEKPGVPLGKAHSFQGKA
jgi:hypothetical protein